MYFGVVLLNDKLTFGPLYIYFTSYYRTCPFKFNTEYIFRNHDSSSRRDVNEVCALLGFYAT
jgi:hypothetical protein